MRYCVYYWLIEPLRGGLCDDDRREPSFDIDIHWKDEGYNFALICDDNGTPEFARLQIPCEHGEEIPEAALPLLTIAREHLLSILRLTWREDARLFPMSSWVFWDENNPRKFNLKVDMLGKETFDIKAASAIFQHAMPIREEFKLFVDGIDDHIPPQYRFLAFYKLLEKRFKHKGVWLTESLRETLESFRDFYKDSDGKKDLVKELHSVRDKCAHIHTGKGKRKILGVTQLNHKESLRVHMILPVLRAICKEIINELSEGKFILGACEPWYERLERLGPNKTVDATQESDAVKV